MSHFIVLANAYNTYLDSSNRSKTDVESELLEAETLEGLTELMAKFLINHRVWKTNDYAADFETVYEVVKEVELPENWFEATPIGARECKTQEIRRQAEKRDKERELEKARLEAERRKRQTEVEEREIYERVKARLEGK